MKFSYSWLKELVPFRDTPQELAEFLTMRVFEVESIEKVSDDWMLDIKLLPNRMADASGHIGMALEIASLKKSKLQIPNYKQIPNSKLQTKNFLQIRIEDPDDCSRYTARVMEDVTVGPSPAWMRERLEVCGLQSINNVVDAANYVMLETGQPLHVFDMQKLKSKNEKVKSIAVRRAKEGERIAALDDRTYELNPEILVIADDTDPLAIAGIKGGKASGVSAGTTRIILESAHFDPVRIRTASRQLGIRTDASIRFEHGLDPNEALGAVDRLTALIQRVAGGAIFSGTTDQYPRKAVQRAILFRPAYAEQIIGAKIPAAFYRTAFSRLGWDAKPRGKNFIIMPPPVRRDIEIEEDVIEEVARLFDYKNVPEKMPEAALASAARNEELFWEERIRDILVGAGFSETELYHFTGARELGIFGFTSDTAVAVENPANADAQYLVPRLAIKYISSVAENLCNFDEVRIFGIGKSFIRNLELVPDPVGDWNLERKDLVLALARKGSAGDQEFYELKGAVDALLESLGISDRWYDGEANRQSPIANRQLFHPYRFVEIKIGDEKIGTIGEIHPAVLENIKSKARITAAEIDFEKLARLATNEAEFRPIGRYPAITRDIAVIVPVETRAQEMENAIQSAGGDLLADTDLFDYFQDDALMAEAQKSLAFHLVFQSTERTLTDMEVEAAIKKIIAALEEKNWEVKK